MSERLPGVRSRWWQRHAHRWGEEGREFIPGLIVTKSKNAAVDEVQRLRAGETIVTYRCAECGRRTQDRLRGQVPSSDDIPYVTVIDADTFDALASDEPQRPPTKPNPGNRGRK